MKEEVKTPMKASSGEVYVVLQCLGKDGVKSKHLTI